MTPSIYTALDANFNRCMEGLRVCEDVFRFIYLNHDISSGLKKLRHQIKHLLKSLPGNMLLSARDINADDQKFADAISGETRENIQDVFKANIHRAIEAARVIEELSKILYPSLSAEFQSLRFRLYEIEKMALSYIIKTVKVNKLKGKLYAILDSEFIKENSYRKTAEAFIKGGAGAIQLRMKKSSAKEYLSTAREISNLCKSKDVLFIVNDNPAIAFLSNSDGIHLGQDDISIKDAEKIITHDSIIGISTESLEEVRKAIIEFPDYLAIGPVFNTSSKNGIDIPGIGIDIIKEIKSETDKPLVAIGGINRENISDVIKSGADCAAVISALYKNGFYEENARELSDLIIGASADMIS